VIGTNGTPRKARTAEIEFSFILGVKLRQVRT